MRQRLVWLAAATIVLAGLATAPTLFDRLDSSLDPHPGSESEVTEAELIGLTGTDGEIVALVSGPGDPAHLVVHADQLSALDGVASASLITEADSATALFIVAAEAGLRDDHVERLLVDATSVLSDIPADAVTIGGSLPLDEELGSTAEADLVRADAITIPIVLLLLGAAVGRLRAGLFALAVLVIVVTGSLAVLATLTAFTTVSVFAVNVVSLFGIGLAVDYSLLILSRFREELNRHDMHDAIARATATAGRAVVYSGLTVATSLSALLVFREPVVRSLAYGGTAATLLAVGAANRLLPVLLRRWGHHLRPAPPRPEGGALHRLTASVQRHPASIGAATIAVLVIMAFPLTSISIEGLDARSLPASSPTRQLAQELPDRSPDVQLSPVTVLAAATSSDPGLATFLRDIDDLSTSRVVTTTELGQHTIIDIDPPGAATDADALQLVRDIRAIDTDLDVGVTGEAAEEVDLLDSIADRLPLAATLLVSATFLLLAAFAGAPVAAAKAVAINALSIAASFGSLVWIFQQGHLSGLLGVDSIGGLDAVVLLITFAFAFGLSMDYEVFLLARIKEHYDRTGNNALAVAAGLRHAGRVVTIGAALIIVVFIGFASGELLVIKQLGIGLALAVAIDASLVRLLLVPASMTVLGSRNWWNPSSSDLATPSRASRR